MTFPERGHHTSHGGDWSQSQTRNAWHERYSKGYFTAEGDLQPDFVRRGPIEELIEHLVHPAGREPALTSSQVRRFFQHCRLIERHLRSRSKTWNQVRADVLKLDIAAADALGKGGGGDAKIPVAFREFIQWNVDASKEEKDFCQGFLRHFEAVIGFGSGKFQSRG